MVRGELERRELKKQIRGHIRTITSEGVSRQELADELHVTKQAISSYIKGRTTPKSHIVRRLLRRWPRNFKFRDVEFPPEAFGAVSEDTAVPVSKQGYLLDVLSALKKENMRVEVERRTASETELRLIIKIRA
jgi:transcriptional regulator with XRE-family HTH domain